MHNVGRNRRMAGSRNGRASLGMNQILTAVAVVMVGAFLLLHVYRPWILDDIKSTTSELFTRIMSRDSQDLHLMKAQPATSAVSSPSKTAIVPSSLPLDISSIVTQTTSVPAPVSVPVNASNIVSSNLTGLAFAMGGGDQL